AQPFALAGGASCTMAFNFKPTTSGPIAGNAVLTDNNLNQPGSLQTIPMNGTGIALVKAILTSPAPGSTLPGASATFNWTAGTGVTLYEFRLGTTGPGSNNVYNSTNTPTNALTTGVVNNIPTTGATIYARLYSDFNGVWQYND